MSTPSINREMLQYFVQLSEPEKKSVLQMIKTFLKNKQVPPQHISIEQYNKEIAEAEAEFDRGDFITHEEMLNEIKYLVF